MPLKILVVEDDPLMLELMAQVLASFEAEVRTLNDSQEAAGLVDRERFDGIFLDLQMPKLNGLQLAGKIRQSPSNRSTPIIVVTGNDDPKVMAQAFAVGGTFFLQKPIDRAKLAKLFKIARGIMFDNQRRYIRIPFETDARCEIGAKVVKGTTVNISEGGMLIEAGDLGAPGTTLLLVLRLPAQTSTSSLPGTVVWVDEKSGRTGIQFTNIAPKDKQFIREFITSYLS
ncbi:MAG TPA: response regulator [Terriglobales bacterium]|jgi:CheY-like chemotaxis protein|nr:response regulator [Terriglobales bacterium]